MYKRYVRFYQQVYRVDFLFALSTAVHRQDKRFKCNECSYKNVINYSYFIESCFHIALFPFFQLNSSLSTALLLSQSKEESRGRVFVCDDDGVFLQQIYQMNLYLKSQLEKDLLIYWLHFRVA